MSYRRVIPRDLFNEASLLKCYGQIFLELEREDYPGIEFIHKDPGAGFNIEQDAADGGLYVSNVLLSVQGSPVELRRPLNARGAFPLYVITDEDEIAVFDEAGRFTDEMRAFLGFEPPAPGL